MTTTQCLPVISNWKFRTSRIQVFCAALVLLSASAVSAQEQTNPDKNRPPNTTSQAGQSNSEQSGINIPVVGDMVDVLKRPSLFFPSLATTTRPLSSSEKFKLFLGNSVSGSAILGSAAGAGLSQEWDGMSGYGQGGEGYAKRFGSSMARNASSNFFGTWLLASAFHQDPRFFVKPTSDIRVAVKYAVRRTFITRSDINGASVFNWSGLLGPLAGEALANTYMPSTDQSVGHTFERYGTDIGVQAGANVLKQYWPTLSRALHLRPAPTTRTPAPSGSSPHS